MTRFPPFGHPVDADAPGETAPGAGGSADGVQPALPGVPATASAHRHATARHRRRRLTLRGRLVVGFSILVVLAAGALGWYESEANPFGGTGPKVVVDMRAGEPMGSVVAALTREGVIGSSLAFRLWTFLHGQPQVRPGRYQLRRNLPFATLSADLGAGPNVFEVNVIPGTTVSEIANQLSSLPGDLAQTFENEARTGAVRSPFEAATDPGLEGLIGTGTYQITPGEPARALLRAMVARFDAEAKAAGLSPTSTVNGLSAYDVVTVASIAEKEGYFSRYFGKVSRVVYNRLSQGMALDMTSTVLYSLGQDGGPVTPSDEQDTTPYNTYLHTGLTPTPICTPSEAALAAAVSSPPGSWLYFELVTAKKGVMVFSATYTRQLAAERQAAGQSPGT